VVCLVLVRSTMNQKAQALKARTAAFAKSIIDICERIDSSQASRIMTGQLIEAATSVAMNYRAACRARSRAEFVAKIGVVREEADESQGWLELLVETRRIRKEDAEAAISEADELTAIFNSSYMTAKNRGLK
jgi:four helix bundle protein